jgi:hypothetical protein
MGGGIDAGGDRRSPNLWSKAVIPEIRIWSLSSKRHAQLVDSLQLTEGISQLYILDSEI